jgi:hypothetical protein
MLTRGFSANADLATALDAPLRFSKSHPAAFALLFQEIVDPRPAFSKINLGPARNEARQKVSALRRSAAKPGALPEDAAAADAFLAGISMAGVLVPELRDHTPLRRRWQDFCLEIEPPPADKKPDPTNK